MPDDTSTMQGVENKITIPAIFKILNKRIVVESKLAVELADNKIKVPSLVVDQIAETIEFKLAAGTSLM